MASSRVLLVVVLVALGAVTVYELLVAVCIIELGSLPGEGPPGDAIVSLLAAAALGAAALLSAALAWAGRAPALTSSLAPAAGAFMVARFYAFDPYYLPTLVRYAERDVPPTLVFVLAAVSVGVGLLALRRRRLGVALSVPSILACAITTWYSGIGY